MALLPYTTAVPGQVNTELTHTASMATDPGDLCYFDAAAGTLKPAGQLPDQGTAALTQQLFAAYFAGISASRQSVSDTTARNARMVVDTLVLFPCTPSTFEIGDYVAPTYTAGVLSNQNVDKVTDPSRAIGRVAHRYSSATTTVWVRITSVNLSGLVHDSNAPAGTIAPSGMAAGAAGTAASYAGGNGAVHTTGTAGVGGAAAYKGGQGGAASGAAGIGGAGGANDVSGGAGGASSSASGGNAGAGGAWNARGGVGGAASGTGAAAGGVGGAWVGGGGDGGAAAGTSAGGAGATTTLKSGTGGAKAGTGAAAGGAAGALAITGGNGGNTASSGADAGGAGATVTITAGNGGNASAGTGNGGAAGNINLVPATGGTTAGGTAGVDGEIQFNGGGIDIAKYTLGGLAVPTATNCTFFLATKKYRVKAVKIIWDVAAGGTSTVDIIKDTGTAAIAGGTSILAAAQSIQGTARTVATPALSATASVLLLAAGDRLSFKYNHAIQSTSGLYAEVELAPM